MAIAKKRHAARGARDGARKTGYVCMPYGVKQPRNPSVTPQVDCDAIYRDTVKPAVEQAGYVCYRGDEPELGGIIQRSMIRLVADSDVMIADLTCGSPNVLYQIGLRHALRRRTTISDRRRVGAHPLRSLALRAGPYQLVGDQPMEMSRRRSQKTLCAL